MPPKQSEAVKEILKRLPMLNHRETMAVKRELDKILLKIAILKPDKKKKPPQSGPKE
jgi:hypothetical protein